MTEDLLYISLTKWEGYREATTSNFFMDRGVTKIGMFLCMAVLQAEIKTLRGERNLSADKYLCDIKERTSYVSEQLSTATKTAETSLK